MVGGQWVRGVEGSFDLSIAKNLQALDIPVDARVVGATVSRIVASLHPQWEVGAIVEGLEAAPRAFLGLFAGANFGKLLVRVHPESAPTGPISTEDRTIRPFTLKVFQLGYVDLGRDQSAFCAHQRVAHR